MGLFIFDYDRQKVCFVLFFGRRFLKVLVDSLLDGNTRKADFPGNTGQFPLLGCSVTCKVHKCGSVHIWRTIMAVEVGIFET